MMTEPTPASPTPTDARPETVLLVDDEPMIRNLGRALLQHYGYRALLAEDGHQAVEFFARERGNIDLVLLDLTMPGWTGQETLRRLQEIDASVPVLISSGVSSVTITPEERERVAGFVRKPYRAQELATALRAALEWGKQRGPASTAGPA